MWNRICRMLFSVCMQQTKLVCNRSEKKTTIDPNIGWMADDDDDDVHEWAGYAHRRSHTKLHTVQISFYRRQNICNAMQCVYTWWFFFIPFLNYLFSILWFYVPRCKHDCANGANPTLWLHWFGCLPAFKWMNFSLFPDKIPGLCVCMWLMFIVDFVRVCYSSVSTQFISPENLKRINCQRREMVFRIAGG